MLKQVSFGLYVEDGEEYPPLPTESEILEELRNPPEPSRDVRDTINEMCGPVITDPDQQKYWLRAENHSEYFRQDPYERIGLSKPIGGFIP